MMPDGFDMTAGRRERRRPRRGFTVMEVLVVIGLIILLLSILIVAMNKATLTAKVTRTRNLMMTMKQGLIRFKEDIGYYPPVLGRPSNFPVIDPNTNRFLLPQPRFDQSYQIGVQDWFSVTTLADYLIGYGGEAEDGYGEANRPTPGIRSPGRDGVWGATITGGQYGPLNKRNTDGPPGMAITGPVYGPYIELDGDLLASMDGTTDSMGRFNAYFPGEAGYDESDPKVIVDLWGRPIRYYRPAYPSLKQSRYANPALDFDGDDEPETAPSLSHVFALRPYTFRSGEDVQSLLEDFNPDHDDAFTTRELEAAEFALFSSGPDKSMNRLMRVDPDEFNEDNIVEVGP